MLGGLANIAIEYATKRYRSNLINWGMLPLLCDGMPDFEVGDHILLCDIKNAVADKRETIDAYVVKPSGEKSELKLKLGNLTDEEREIILAGCLINYYNK